MNIKNILLAVSFCIGAQCSLGQMNNSRNGFANPNAAQVHLPPERRTRDTSSSYKAIDRKMDKNLNKVMVAETSQGKKLSKRQIRREKREKDRKE